MDKQDWSDVGIDVPYGRHGDVKVHCPQCHGTRRNKSDKSLSCNLDTGVYNCHHCSWSGKLKGWGMQDFEWQGAPKKEWVRPEVEVPEVQDFPESTEKFFADRGISMDVVKRRKIWRDEQGLHFPYFRNEEVVNVKTRRYPKSFSLISGAELVMYGLDDCVGADRVVVVEGEMDVLAIETATGITSILSVPNGASKNAKMSFLQSAESIFENAHTVVLAMDNDDPGKLLEQELSRRIGREKCYRVEWPEGCKDANDALMKHGAEGVIKSLKKAAPYPDSGILTAASASREYFDLYKGVHAKGVKTGWRAVDELYSVRTGELTVVTGAPGAGKSEWVDALMVNLAMREKWSFVVFSPENLPLQLHLKKLAEKYTGRPFNMNVPTRMTETDAKNAIDWIDQHFSFLAPEDTSLDELLRLAHSRILQTGAKGVVIDPWNEVMNKRPGGISETDFIGQCLSRIRRFAQSHDVHFWVIAHPTKLPKDDETGEYIVPGPYDAAGSANWFNRADNFISVWRRRRPYEEGEAPEPTQLHVQKIRWKDVGQLGMAELRYKWETGRYFDLEATDDGPVRFSQMVEPWVDKSGPV